MVEVTSSILVPPIKLFEKSSFFYAQFSLMKQKRMSVNPYLISSPLEKCYFYIMKRFLYSELIKWKNSQYRKPLILEGARQVGKTWLLKQFGNNEYDSFVYINCDNNPLLESIFIDYNIQRIIRNLSALSNITIVPEKPLYSLMKYKSAL